MQAVTNAMMHMAIIEQEDDFFGC